MATKLIRINDAETFGHSSAAVTGAVVDISNIDNNSENWKHGGTLPVLLKAYLNETDYDNDCQPLPWSKNRIEVAVTEAEVDAQPLFELIIDKVIAKMTDAEGQYGFEDVVKIPKI